MIRSVQPKLIDFPRWMLERIDGPDVREDRFAIEEANMAVLGFLFFVGVLAIAVWAMVVTIAPRASYIAALVSGSTAAPMLVPVAQRRRVRRIQPLTARSALKALPAAA